MSDSVDPLAQLANAAQLAPATAEAGAQEDRTAVLLVESGGFWFGLRATDVQEVVERETISRIPAAPAHVLGLAMISARLVPVVALNLLAGRQTADTGGGRVVVVQDEEHRELGLTARRTHGLVELAVDDGAPRSSDHVPWVDNQVRWNNKLAGLVDVKRLIDAATAGARQR